MRVLLTTDTVGGVWTFTQELTLGLLHAGHSVFLLSMGGLPKPSQVLWAQALTERSRSSFRYQRCNAPLEWMDENARTWKDGSFAILKVIDAFNPHLLHSNQLCFGSLACGIPTLVTAHSDVLGWAEACRPDGLEDSPWLDRYSALASKGLSRATHITAPSKWMAAAVERLYGLPGTVEVVPNGRGIHPPASQRLPRAVTAGRLWDEAKDLSLLAHTSASMPILVAGEASHGRVKASSLPAHVTLLGSLDERDLHRLFAQSSIYFATSLYEPFGLAPLEAALCGCALVLRDIPSFREIWGDAALYFSDAPSLDGRLAHLTANANALSDLQARGMRRAKRYTARRMTDRYIQLYQSLLSQESTAGTAPRSEAACAV